MRVILRFGGFSKEIKIPDEKAFKPLTIPHPVGSDAMAHALVQDNPAPFKPIKRMIFEYYRQLEHDLLEYEFAREE